MILLDNLTKIRKCVDECGREITLVAAVKTQTKQTVDEFMRIAPDFVVGENRVQELVDKYDSRYVWHFIGRLQTNKVKYIADKVDLIHSLDRIELAKEIEKQGLKHDRVINCLVEVNMGAEESKGGICPNEVAGFIADLKDYPHICIKGLMSVLPANLDVESLEDLYSQLDGLFESVKQIRQSNVDIKYLSAGMSGDYEIALRHNANVIRIGRLIFGERTYN